MLEKRVGSEPYCNEYFLAFTNVEEENEGMVKDLTAEQSLALATTIFFLNVNG